MGLNFNINREKVSDDEINSHQDFNALVEKFKKQSIKKARGDESWRKNKSIRYSAVILGVTVLCTVTYLSLLKDKQQNQTKHETIITQNTHTQRSNKFIKAPSAKLKTGYSTYKINNGTGGTITHPSGTKITVPKNSFTDRNGNDIVGDVTIEYKEMHDAGDVLVNGIPMAYDSAGTKFSLETAGMFDINGHQNNVPVLIKKEVPVKVELASLNHEDRFNQYYLDTIARNWKYLQRDNIEKKNTETTGKKSVPAASVKKIKQLEQLVNQVLPMRIDSVKDVYSSRINRLPKLKQPAMPAKLTAGRPSFKLEGSYEEFPELSAFENVIFEAGTENRNLPKDIQEITWSDIKIKEGPVKGTNYLLELYYRDRRERLVVYPVLTGKDYEKARSDFDDKLAEFNIKAEKKQAEEKRLIAEMENKQAAYMETQRKKQAELDRERTALVSSSNARATNELASNFNNMSNQVRTTRLFSITQFGIYNSDCPHTVPSGNQVTPVFTISEKDKPVSPDAVYVVDHLKKTVYNLDPREGFKFSYDQAGSYSICVFRKNRMFICSKEQFATAAVNNDRTFMVRALPEGAENIVDFKKALEI